MTQKKTPTTAPKAPEGAGKGPERREKVAA